MTFYDTNSRVKFEEELKSRGYKYWENTSKIDHYDYIYQKCFKDEIGKRYFIDIRFYDFTKYPNAQFEYSCDAFVYFRDNNALHNKKDDEIFFNKWGNYPENYTNVTMTCENIDVVESFVQKLFETMNFEYYERWNEC